MTRIKFCGFTKAEDVEYASELGVDAVGFVQDVGSPRRLDSLSVFKLVRLAAPFMTTVTVFGRFPGLRAVETDLVQAAEFDSQPPVPFILSKRLGGPKYDPPVEMGSCCGFMIDAYSPDDYGGTGQTVDWDIAAELVRRVKTRWILAGGLTPDNVAEAIRIVKPYAVDVSSGIEVSPGVKDHGKMRAFVDAVRSTD